MCGVFNLMGVYLCVWILYCVSVCMCGFFNE
jgi:hypothetical protein